MKREIRMVNMLKIKKLVKEYENQSGIEAQNYRQLEVFTSKSIKDALKSDITWHVDNTQELIVPLEKAQDLCVWDEEWGGEKRI